MGGKSPGKMLGILLSLDCLRAENPPVWNSDVLLLVGGNSILAKTFLEFDVLGAFSGTETSIVGDGTPFILFPGIWLFSTTGIKFFAM